MNEIRVNRLPLLTYRYLGTNDTPFLFEAPQGRGGIQFSDETYVMEGGTLRQSFAGASEETAEAARKGTVWSIAIPRGETAALSITLDVEEAKGFAGAFMISLGKEASLDLTWVICGGGENSTVTIASDYALGEHASLHVSGLVKDLPGGSIYDQRNVQLSSYGAAAFTWALLGGAQTIVHSRGLLSGKGSSVKEAALYAAEGTQKLDLFYHVEHRGAESESDIDVKGSLNGRAKKLFRGTIDFKRGCHGSVGNEGDYAIQLSPTTKNISLPLLLCTEDDVVGNHASNAGQLDEHTIYFLMSRGFSLEEARRIVVESLIRPMIDNMSVSLREEVLCAVRSKLDAKEAYSE
ncbi:MAG: SufD family Fe-S cluster assembly protein [Dialister sp.]|nr:SufD family Fe-S cluster assembly protein [Dialister sp.]